MCRSGSRGIQYIALVFDIIGRSYKTLHTYSSYYVYPFIVFQPGCNIGIISFLHCKQRFETFGVSVQLIVIISSLLAFTFQFFDCELHNMAYIAFLVSRLPRDQMTRIIVIFSIYTSCS